MILPEQIEVREGVFRERDGDVFQALGEKVLVLEAELFDLHAITIMDVAILSRPNRNEP
jgi:hypothetical protein